MPPNYVYKKIPLDNHNFPRQFRLLVLEPGSGNTKLVGQLIHHDIPGWNKSEAIDYEAVSWTWGEDVPEAQLPNLLIVGSLSPDQRKEVRLPIKENLAAALRCLRYPDKPRVLWVDYVCINQADKIERNDQVKLMLEIYRYANNVCVWLGEHANHSERAIAFIKKLNDLDNWRTIIKEISDENHKQKAHEEWRALAALMDRAWFSRRWIVQELSLAQRATIYCGTSTLQWRDFETAVSLFERDAERLNVHFQGLEIAEYDHEYFKEVGNMAATRLVRLHTDLFSTDRTTEEIAKRYSLTDLVANMWSFEAKDPRDLIYAVLSLAADVRSRLDGPMDAPAPDAGDAGSGLASSGKKRKLVDLIGMNDDDDRAPIETSSATTSRNSTGLESTGSKVAVLSDVFGFVLDKINHIEYPSIAGSVPAEWLDMGGYDPDNPEKDVDHLWRTLVADRGPNGRNPPEHFRRAFIYCAKAGYELSAINNEWLRRRQHPVVSEFLDRMLATVSRRRLFVSARESFLGLAPAEAEKNDHICIVRGMSVPVVLRPCYDAATNELTHYQMIGACYVHTMMDGHAIDKQSQAIGKLNEDRVKNADEIDLLTSHKLLLR